MQQYRQMKDAHPECVLFFRMGDFYEMFDEDARVVSKSIGLTLTQRGNGLDMAGVPFHAAEGYMRKMVDAGFRVAVCEQRACVRHGQSFLPRLEVEFSVRLDACVRVQSARATNQRHLDRHIDRSDVRGWQRKIRDRLQLAAVRTGRE